NVFINTFGDLFVIQLKFNPQVASANPGASAGPGTAASTSEEASENIVSEYISKLAENVFHIHSAAAKTTASTISHSGMSKPIVLGPFVRVAQYFIGFCRLFKFFLGFLISRI